jgi:glycosyltransferase involved in cell wall biosynthesis
MPSISYAITACNEHVELKRLLDQLVQFIEPEDEIMVQLDSTATLEVKKVAEMYNVNQSFEYHRIYSSLNGDFASFKNNLKNHCTRDYIFFIDADEYFSDHMLRMLKQVLVANPDIECFAVPRVNTVEGITQEHIQKWGWRVDDKGRINWPDFQTRICKKSKDIKWVGAVHERLEGWKTISSFPYDFEDWALRHPKTIERQEKQNDFYNKI